MAKLKKKTTWTMQDVKDGIVSEDGKILKPDSPRLMREDKPKDTPAASGMTPGAQAPEVKTDVVDPAEAAPAIPGAEAAGPEGLNSQLEQNPQDLKTDPA